ncbi:hypothetical protein ZWY2020_052168 [Hordeum vulgare]|nr:hypothetical protein ZWY2020_052168 [Hordeum vulgare]
MALRRTIVSLNFRFQASYYLPCVVASPPMLMPRLPLQPSFGRPVTVPCRYFTTPSQQVKKVFKDNKCNVCPNLNNDITPPFPGLVTDEEADDPTPHPSPSSIRHSVADVDDAKEGQLQENVALWPEKVAGLI